MRPSSTSVDLRLPAPPSEQEKLSYFGSTPRWAFLWLFASQCLLVGSYAAVMRRSPETTLGLVLLTFMVPPVLVNVWLRMRSPRTTLGEHLALVERHRGLAPSVDVFLPVCGENSLVLDNTFRHVRALEHAGRLRVLVLDDADDPSTAALARAHGLDYVVRPNRGEWKKAGNLIHAFEQTSGEFVLVFDADFAPRSDFLREVLPYMQDPVVGVVQTAQYFDHDGVNDFARFAGALQELFFRWTQPARDTYEAAICAGTNVLYRRAAVDAAGGFAKVPLGEDVHSGVKIWVAHYRTRYVPLVLAKGLAPDTWEALTNQQYRWCRSSMLLMISSIFRDAPFSRRMRLCFFAAFVYYMSSAAMVLTSTVPTLATLYLFPEQVHWYSYLPLLPAFGATFVVFPRLARGWSPRMYRVSTVNTFCHLLAVTHALRQQVASWVPTGAAQVASSSGTSTPVKVARMLRVWLVVVQVLLWTGIARAARQQDPWLFAPAAALAAYQLVMLGPFLLSKNPRQLVRVRTARVAETGVPAGRAGVERPVPQLVR